MPELTVIQNLNRTVFRTTTLAEMRFRRHASGTLRFIRRAALWAAMRGSRVVPMAWKNECLRDRV